MSDESPPPEDFDYGERKEDGQFERHPTTDQGEFVQPVRESYVHTEGCGSTTTMGTELAESFARDPHQYGKTFCAGCNDYFPIEEFHWKGTDQPLDEVGPDPAEEPTKADLIGAAAEEHGVDLDQAIAAADDDPESSRIFILEAQPPDYRLIAFGMDADGNPASDVVMDIPRSAVNGVGGLFHAANMHLAETAMANEQGEDSLGFRELSEGMGLSEPLNESDSAKASIDHALRDPLGDQ